LQKEKQLVTVEDVEGHKQQRAQQLWLQLVQQSLQLRAQRADSAMETEMMTVVARTCILMETLVLLLLS